MLFENHMSIGEPIKPSQYAAGAGCFKKNIFVFAFGLFSCLAISPKASAKSSGVNIPVRMAFMAGYHSSENVFKDNRDKNPVGGLGIGLDFSVPFKSLNFSLGLGGWLVPPAKTENSAYNLMYLMTVYARYLGSNYDFFVGPGVSAMTYRTESSGTSGSSTKLESGSMGCGVTGARVFFGKDLSAGLGLSGYYCMTGSYNNTISTTTPTADVKSEVSEKASSYGGLVFLFFEWNEERRLF